MSYEAAKKDAESIESQIKQLLKTHKIEDIQIEVQNCRYKKVTVKNDDNNKKTQRTVR